VLRLSRVTAALLSATAIVLPASALASTPPMVMVQGLGLFSHNAPTTAESAPDESFGFSFQMANPPIGVGVGPQTLLTTAFENFAWTVNQVVQPVTLKNIVFSPEGLAFTFADNTEIDFDGPMVLTNGSAEAPSWGQYLATVIPAHAMAFSDVGTAMVVVTDASPTPEPATWTLMIGGFAALGAALRHRRRLALA
jgi:hypothetical protein